MEKFLTVKEFCDRYRIGRSTVYREMATGRLTIVKIGRATRIAECHAEQWEELLIVSDRV